jgi:hypothetical protein
MKQTNLQNIDLLNQLRLDIERAWNDSHDQEIVHRLAREHPDLSERLYEFFADIVAMSLAPDAPQPDLRGADDRMLAWLESEGFGRIAQARQSAKESATPTPRPTPTGQAQNLVAFLKARTRQDMDGLAWALGITSRFLLDLSNHPAIVPEKARLELAQRAELKWSIAKLETLQVLHQPMPGLSMRRVASRSTPFTVQSVTYEAVVRRSDLDDKQKKFWFGLA